MRSLKTTLETSLPLLFERDNGIIENIPANLIKFIDKPIISISRFINTIGEPVKSTFDDDTFDDNAY